MTNSCTPESAETIRQLYTPGISILYAEGVHNAACNNGQYTVTASYECYLIHSTTTAICPQVFVSSRNELINASYNINTTDPILSVLYFYITNDFFEILSDIDIPGSVCLEPFDLLEYNFYITINTHLCPPYDNMSYEELQAHNIACCT